jgi:hypothetical protein
MKIMNKLYLGLLGVLVCVGYGFQCLDAQNTSSIDSQVKLSGSSLRSGDLIVKSDVICVGEITTIGSPLSRATGQDTYAGVKIQISQDLKSHIDSPALVEIVVAKEHDLKEEAPELETSYIFFIKKIPGWNIVLKLLPATDDNIAKVKALIAAAPAPK